MVADQEATTGRTEQEGGSYEVVFSSEGYFMPAAPLTGSTPLSSDVELTDSEQFSALSRAHSGRFRVSFRLEGGMERPAPGGGTHTSGAAGRSPAAE